MVWRGFGFVSQNRPVAVIFMQGNPLESLGVYSLALEWLCFGEMHIFPNEN